MTNQAQLLAVWICAITLAPMRVLAGQCGDLVSLTIPDTNVMSAEIVSAAVTPGRGRGPATNVPSHCRVMAVAKPVTDSEIHLEVWLPSPEQWNGKFLGTGNGGYSGSLSTTEMSEALTLGYAVAGSDTGHQGGDLKFGAGHSEKINDWGFRAIHVMTENAKLIVRAYYGRFPQRAYFTGCSTGGHQALSEAQRYPADYDGIVAGDPGNDRVHLNANFLWAYTALHKEPGNDLPAAKLPVITKAAMAACDAADGIKDGIIADARQCKFDPGVLLCKGSDEPGCLTAPQLATLKKIYDGPRNPRTGARIMPGFPIGSESGWTGYFVGQREPARTDFWRLWVFNNPAWEWRNFDFDADLAYADRKLAAVNAVETDLREFRANHGKLLIYQGWADPVVPPEGTILYFEAMEKRMQGPRATSDFARLFMVPGMGHCSGGVGPSSFDALSALDVWATNGTAPAKIVASHSTAGKVDRTRPLCPYPLTARWKGTGSTDDANSFYCGVVPRVKTAVNKNNGTSK